MDAKERLIALKENEEFLAEISEVKEAQELQRICKNFGVEVSLEDAAEALDFEQKRDGEISEEDIEAVTGGGLSLLGLGVLLTFMLGFSRGSRCNKKKK